MNNNAHYFFPINFKTRQGSLFCCRHSQRPLNINSNLLNNRWHECQTTVIPSWHKHCTYPPATIRSTAKASSS